MADQSRTNIVTFECSFVLVTFVSRFFTIPNIR